jgi:hypothetical protein
MATVFGERQLHLRLPSRHKKLATKARLLC